MSAEKQYAERDLILAQRVAWARARCGALWLSAGTLSARWGHDAFAACPECTQKAALIYPLPTVTRPRVLTDSVQGMPAEWRVIDGNVQWRRPDQVSTWRGVDETHGMFITTERARIIVDLLNNPTETVEDDA